MPVSKGFAAGLQVAARFKEPLDDVAISTAALARMVDTPALSTYCQLEPKERGLVIGFGNTPIERIGPAVGVLKSVIHTQSK